MPDSPKIDPFINIGSPTSGSTVTTNFSVSGAVEPAGSSVTVKVKNGSGTVVAQGTKAASGGGYSVPLSSVPAGGPYSIESCITNTTTCATPVNNITVKS